MMKIYLMTLLLFFPLITWGQEDLDSLSKAYQTLPNDTQKVQLLIKLAFAYHSSEPEKTLEVAEEGLAISKKIQYHRGVIMFYNLLGIGWNVQSKYANAVEQYLKAVDYAHQHQISSGMTNVYNSLGIVNDDLGKYEEAIKWYYLAYEGFAKSNNMQPAGSTLTNIGAAYEAMDSMKLSLEYYLKAKFVFDTLSTPAPYNQGSLYSNLARVYRLAKVMDTAAYYIDMALRIAEEEDDHWLLLSAYDGYAALDQERGAYEEMAHHAGLALEYALKLGAHRNRARILYSLGEASAYLGRYEEATTFFKRHIAAKDSLNLGEQNERIAFLEQEHDKTVAQREKLREEGRIYRRNWLIYNGVISGLAALMVIIVILSRTSVSERWVKGILFFLFLVFFEFLLLVLEPLVDRSAAGNPGIKLMVNVGLAIVLVPLHDMLSARAIRQLTRTQQA